MKKFLIVSNMLFASTVVFGMDQRQAISDQQLCSMVVTAFQQQKSDNNVPQSKWSPELWEKIISKASQEKEYFNIPRNSEEWTLLMYATKYSTLEIVEKLLKLKDSSGCKLIDIDAQRKKMTALAIAIFNKDIDKIRLLLKYGADVYKNHLFDIDAPKLAVMRGCPKILSIFEDQVNNDLQLISSAAFCEAQDVNAIKELLKSGAYINYQYLQKETLMIDR